MVEAGDWRYRTGTGRGGSSVCKVVAVGLVWVEAANAASASGIGQWASASAEHV